jgi:hypothetical protein
MSIENQRVESGNNYNYLGCDVSFDNEHDMNNNIIGNKRYLELLKENEIHSQLRKRR